MLPGHARRVRRVRDQPAASGNWKASPRQRPSASTRAGHRRSKRQSARHAPGRHRQGAQDRTRVRVSALQVHSKSEPEMTAARSGGRRPSSNLDVEVLYKEVRRCRSDPYAGKPTSQTLVKRHRVSISCMCFSSEAAGAVAAFLHAASVKWIWLFQNPATMVLPVQSMTRASLVIARRCGGPRGDHAARHDNDAIPERSGIR
jgi:hypothetical protein